MTARLISPAIILFALSAFYAQQAAASDPYSYHSAICEAITPAQSGQMEWRENGLINKDPSRSLWVMCPMPIKTDDNEDVNFGVALANPSDSVVDVDCILRIFDEDGGMQSYSHTLRIQPGQIGVKTWDVNDEAFWPAIQCNLPPNTVLRGMEGRY